VGQLVSGVAHELNNPLSVVIGHGQLMLSRNLPPEIRRPVELIVAQGDRMAKIVQSLLLFSRQRSTARGAVDLPLIIDQTLVLRAAQLRLSGVAVVIEHAPGLPPADGDAHQLQQVILNLLLNAEQALLQSRKDVTSPADAESRPGIPHRGPDEPARGGRARVGACGAGRQRPRHRARGAARGSSSRSSPPRRSGRGPGSG
jgi:signal transduction histidine kinase